MADTISGKEIWNRRNANAPLWLYRLYDTDQRLLYVGVSKNLRQRISAHRRSKSWWPQVAGVVARYYGNRREALEQEWAAIATEDPAYNIASRGHLRKPVL